MTNHLVTKFNKINILIKNNRDRYRTFKEHQQTPDGTPIKEALDEYTDRKKVEPSELLVGAELPSIAISDYEVIEDTDASPDDIIEMISNNHVYSLIKHNATRWNTYFYEFRRLLLSKGSVMHTLNQHIIPELDQSQYPTEAEWNELHQLVCHGLISGLCLIPVFLGSIFETVPSGY